MVENARRRATKAVMAKICPSSSPESRSAWMSAGVVAFGALTTFPAHAAMAFSLSVSPASVPSKTPRRDSGVRRLAQLPAPGQRAVRVPEGRGGCGHQDPALAEGQAARRECLRHHPEQVLHGVWLVRPQPGHVPYVPAVREVLVIEGPHLGGHRGFLEKAAGHARSAP